MFDGIIYNMLTDAARGVMVWFAAQLGLTGTMQQQFIAGGLAVVAGLWAWYENKGHQQIVEALKNAKGPTAPAQARAGNLSKIASVLGFFAVLSTFHTLYIGDARAADLPLPGKAPIVQPAIPASPCTPQSCKGFDIGVVLGTNTQNANILPTLTTVSGGNGFLGGSVGYRFWNGNIYIGVEFDALAQTGQSGTALNFNPQNVMFTAEGRVGLSLAGLFNTPTSNPSQGPLQNIINSLQTSLMTPYIAPVADCFNNVGGGTIIQRYCVAAGAEFSVGGPITVDVEYENTPAAGGLTTANLLKLKLKYNL